MSSVLSLKNVSAYYPSSATTLFGTGGWTQILFEINFDLNPGEILSVVGESGSGKSTLGKSIIGLIPKVGGSFEFNSEEYQPSVMNHLRKKIQIIFQDPYSSLNPRMTVSETLNEVVEFYPNELNPDKRLSSLLDQTELPKDSVSKYPHELSGGQRQRVCIARSLAVEPDVLICDEIVSALDVSVQAKILNLIKDLSNEKSIAVLFTTHDLHVVESFANNVLIMTKGRIVESGNVKQVFKYPEHDYTQMLIHSVPNKKRLTADEFLMPSSSS
ncbi:MAG: ABC transporter ATP-binding protein [Candidatus Marinimicrobia bacterium]|nr:ABC transporter ATP-binding protein [Candidatus Neomarinimicrobiota bacterium]MBT4280565.1 ABC transporter ATP-binding protein [Candidatus Neomarinimicrobiota bacterium]MBT4795426.1 ABC transporter ATP-binding protein [Candidatus Neomarinimicrobiota bacterium]MBT5340433.1 ABC transporter ATP-binding protein [Candidatus Neomarinimicrobiota bacterium]MBT6000021.1 ABC transporter ATP-binding protein [Candidatus Neomarinimicrobiota bacterium]